VEALSTETAYFPY